jgi:hypothetical protein
MCTLLPCLAVIFATAQLDAAPAPAPNNKAKEKLEALKKRLPVVLDAWVKERSVTQSVNLIPVLRRVRLIGDGQAKVVVHLHSRNEAGQASDSALFMVTIYLSFYDGLWTTTRFEWGGYRREKRWEESTPFLMDAIDEAAEK